MRSVRVAVALASIAGGATGCLRATTFTCTTDQACPDGVCESTGYCSFADSSCTGGRRYGGLSGPLADQCVGGGGDIDAPAGSADAADDVDAHPSLCPASYAPVTGAPNVYRSITAPANWTNQEIQCAADGGYLIVPDDASELAAITGFAGVAIWVGIGDQATEGTFLTVRGVAATFLPWAAGQPDNNPPGEDCVKATGTTISDERCNLQSPAVCECEP